MIAALVVLAVFLWAAEAWAQNQYKRTERGSEAQQGAQWAASPVSGKLPEVDRLSRRGVIFTDWYSRQSCTSGRAAFETGRYPARAGLTKTGMSDSK
jgi:arylsulfatase A-like enzyme